jgi:hypothetical protein
MVSPTQLGAERTLETVENQKLLQVGILHGAFHAEREHVSICTQLFLTLLVKHDELLVRVNVRSIRSRARTAVQVPVCFAERAEMQHCQLRQRPLQRPAAVEHCLQTQPRLPSVDPVDTYAYAVRRGP